MAIDTVEKRLSALLDYVLLPDGNINAFDRASLLGQYNFSLTSHDNYAATLFVNRGKLADAGVFQGISVSLRLA